MKISNPIMPGFYPDPSICAVGDKFYLVNSSFAYFPGVPIFESEDLKHFTQIGNILDRPSQLPLLTDGMSRGIFAPTIRYHEGTFYMITTNVSYGGNFVVTATNPAGPWSEPHYLAGADGIDPSLFFDEDGKCYYIGTRPNPEGVGHNGDWYIYIQELDLINWKLLGEYKLVWNGAMRKAEWPEGPHLYKKDGYYYIMHAEGGTGPAHAVCVARSKEIYGPYEGTLMNPVFTHRHLGKAYGIRYVGHADLVQAKDGNWYAVMLASRPCEGFTNLGRETFLAKVTWEDGWPVFNAGIGMLEKEVTVPFEENNQEILTIQNDKDGIPFNMVRLRNPAENMVVREGEGYRMKLSPNTLSSTMPISYLGIRQTSYYFKASTTVKFCPQQDNEAAGLALLQSESASLAILLKQQDRKKVISIVKSEKQKEQELVLSEVSSNEVTLSIRQDGQKAVLSFDAGNGEQICNETFSTAFLSTELAGGFVGCTVGMYATANGAESSNSALFSGIEYRNEGENRL